MLTKPCNKCKADKPATLEFWHSSTSNKDRLTNTCKACKSEADKVRYQRLREETIERASVWHRNNSKRKQEYDRNYRADNKEKIAADKKAQALKFQTERPEEWKAQAINRSAQRRDLILNQNQYLVTREDIRQMQLLPCYYCKSKELIEIDHRLPLSRGGSHSIGNLVPACRGCNRRKAHRTVMEWRTGKVISQDNKKPIKGTVHKL